MVANTKKFKLNRGVFVGFDPVKKLNRIYEPGEIIESNMNLEHFNDPRCKDDPRWAKKFELLPEQGQTVPAGAAIFDPSKETLEQFAERMKAEMTISNALPNIDESRKPISKSK